MVVTRTDLYSLAQVAEDYLPEEWTDGVRWLTRRLKAGELKGVQTGRTWQMRGSDIEYMLAKFSNDEQVKAREQAQQVAAAPTTFTDALSPRSLRRLRRVQ